MTKEAALKKFFSGFGITAYPSTAVPENVEFPYLTYEVITSAFEAEENMVVDYGQQCALKAQVNAVVIQALGGINTPAYSDKNVRSRTYSECNRDIQNWFRVNSRNDITLFPRAKWSAGRAKRCQLSRIPRWLVPFSFGKTREAVFIQRLTGPTSQNYGRHSARGRSR